MPKIAKIKIYHPLQKTAIVGISLNGRGVYTQEEVAALIKQANKFRNYIIILHGDKVQCAAWRAKHELILKDVKRGTELLDWNVLQEAVEWQGCREKLQEFIGFYKNPINDDFIKGIQATVELYLARHQEEKDAEKVKTFILEEMAFLTHLAIAKRIDCFIYTGKELPAFYVTKKYFFIGVDQNLMEWGELSFAEEKIKKQRSLPKQKGDSTDTVTTSVFSSFTLFSGASAMVSIKKSSSDDFESEKKSEERDRTMQITDREVASLSASSIDFLTETSRLNGKLQAFQILLAQIMQDPKHVDQDQYFKLRELHATLTKTMHKLRLESPTHSKPVVTLAEMQSSNSDSMKIQALRM